jgi:serine/threonine protein kinase/tetratricopeptide (TPR) repeat protein/TolB-like protein
MSTTENPSPASHAHRTAEPKLTPERWQQIKEVFADAQERDPAQRGAFLQEVCGADEILRSEVESLLAAAESKSVSSASGSTSAAHFHAEDPMIGRRIGAYKVTRRIGRGGMATVYLASRADEQYEKRVAIKVLLPELDSDELLRRFRNERQTLAKLDHPNIVKLLDGGSTEEGLPYLVMDYVEGAPIDTYCDTRRLSTEERLRLFCQVCAAVQCAHQNLVVHRDLKPSNILITNDGTPKLLDFGISKVLQPSNGSPVTQTLTRRMTPAYASPEQVRGEPVTTATDIYSLGVVLYELLTGHRPYKLKQNTPAEVERAICEQEPEKPSTAVNRVEVETLSDGTTVSRTPALVSASREGQPEKLRRRLSGDLDNVVLMALQKETQRRYNSVGEFAEDVQRHLQHRMITARRSTLAYRTSKFIRRHKTEVVAAMMIVVVLLAATGYTFWEQRRATERARAELASRRSRGRRSVAVLGFKNLSARADTAWLSTALSEMLTTELAAGGKLRMIPGESVAQAKINLSLPEADSLSALTLDRVYMNLGSDFVVLGSYLDMGDASRGVRLDLRVQDAALRETVASLAETGSEAALPDLVTRTGAALRERLGIPEIHPAETERVQSSLPANPEAIRLYAEGLARLRIFDALGARDLLQRAVGADPDDAMAHSALADAWAALGYDTKVKEEAKKAFGLVGGLPRQESLLIEGRYRQSAGEWEKAIEIYRTLFNFFPDNLDYGLQLSAAQVGASRAKDSLVTLDDLRKLPSPFGADPRIDLAEATAAGRVSDYRRSANAASQALQKGKTLGARLIMAQALIAEGGAFASLGDAKRANVASSEARELFVAAGDHFGEARALRNIGAILLSQGDFENGKKTLQEAMTIQHALGNRSGEMDLLGQLTHALYRQGDLAGAKKAAEGSLAIARELGDRVNEGHALNTIAGLEGQQGQPAAAKKHFEEALAIDRAVGNKAEAARVLNNFANLLMAEGSLLRARQMLEECVAISRSTGNKDDLGIALLNLAGLRSNAGELAPAQRSFSEALQIVRETGNDAAAAYILHSQADILALQGDLSAAHKKNEEALAMQEHMGAKVDAARSRVSMANLSLDEGHVAEAEKLARQAAEQFRSQNDVAGEADADVALIDSLRTQGKLAEAQSLADVAQRLAEKSGDRGTAASVAIANARVRASSGNAEEAVTSLQSTVKETGNAGMRAAQFDARLALGETEMKSGSRTAARAELTSLERDAKAKGFLLVARKAAAARKQR